MYSISIVCHSVILEHFEISTDFQGIIIVQNNVSIAKCSSMPEWHTVKIASTGHGDHISGIKA